MLFEPKDILKALKRIESVNLRHLTTRRDKGYVAPVETVIRGGRPKYDMRNALIYCVGAHLEDKGFDMDVAYKMATEVVDFHITECVRDVPQPWVVIFQGKDRNFYTVLSDVCKDYQDTLSPENVLYLNILPNVYLRMHKSQYDFIEGHFGRIEGLHAVNVRRFVRGALGSLGVNLEGNDVRELILAEKENYMKRVAEQMTK